MRVCIFLSICVCVCVCVCLCAEAHCHHAGRPRAFAERGFPPKRRSEIQRIFAIARFFLFFFLHLGPEIIYWTSRSSKLRTYICRCAAYSRHIDSSMRKRMQWYEDTLYSSMTCAACRHTQSRKLGVGGEQASAQQDSKGRRRRRRVGRWGKRTRSARRGGSERDTRA